MYYRIRRQVIDALKRKAQAANGLTEEAFYKGNAQGGLEGCYTLRNVNDNLSEPMDDRHLAEFSAGRSREASLRFLGSSYAMLYNLLGNRFVSVDGKRYRIFYKQRLRALKSKNAYTSLDALLLSEDGGVCICMEAKLIEWFVFKVNPLRDTFLHSKNYHESQAAESFMDAFRILVPYYQSDSYEHIGCLKQYDGFLVLRQLLALYHTIWEEQRRSAHALGDIHRLIYENIYWHAEDLTCYGSYGGKIERAKKRMEQEEALFRELSEQIVCLFRETLNIELQLRICEHRQFMKRLALPEEKRIWLERYNL